MNVKVSLLLLFSSIVVTLCADTMKIEVIERPKECTRKAKKGDKVSMHYDGVLSTGKPFDSSRSRNTPFDFQLGVKQVISCWDEGIPGMCIGEKRKLTCPPEYAYGDRGFGDIIPAKSTLVFDVELLGISGAAKQETKKEEPKQEQKETKEKEVNEESEEHAHEHEHGDSFESVDTDGNGEVSREEMTAYIKNYSAGEGEEEPNGDEDIATLISEIFQSDDTNKDGVLSKEEFYHGAGEFSNENNMMNEMEVDENDLKDEL